MGLLRARWITRSDTEMTAGSALQAAASWLRTSTDADAAERARMESVSDCNTTQDEAGCPRSAVGTGRSALAQSTDPIQARRRRSATARASSSSSTPSPSTLAIAMITAAPAETRSEGGTASNQMVGSAETSVELYFDRSIETAAASYGRDDGQRVTRSIRSSPTSGCRRICGTSTGSILGGDETYFEKVGGKLVNIDDVAGMKIRPGSGTDMFTRLFDIGLSGVEGVDPTDRPLLQPQPRDHRRGHRHRRSSTPSSTPTTYRRRRRWTSDLSTSFNTTSESGADRLQPRG